MLCNSFIDNIITAVSATAVFKTVEWGIELPPQTADLTWAKDTLPACFLWGGNSKLTVETESGALKEEQTMNAYIFLYYKKTDTNDQHSGIDELNRIEKVFITELFKIGNTINLRSDIIIDRDTTLLKLGSVWNYLPPFYASRIEFTLETNAYEL